MNALARIQAELAKRAKWPADEEQARRIAELYASAALRRARAENRLDDPEEGNV